MNREEIKELIMEMIQNEDIVKEIVLEVVEEALGDLTSIREYNEDNIFN